ncbi:MAG TPA: TauD/TfdA family dioxygenase [Burkholderiales bacterium]|nr:TauD/TfdA family dioxygenase [Burkholderiales bacterium]
MKLRKLAPAIGAEVLDVDLSQPMDDALFRDIERAWHEHCVLLFRSQTLDGLQQVAFAARFGELAHTLKDYEGGKIHPALMYVTNEKKDGKYVGALPDGEMFFHSDMCYLERPLSAAMLFAIALPPEGGNTILASMYAACDALPADLREKLEGRLAMNSYEPGYGTSNVQMRIRAPASPTAHGFAHPVIRTHAATGRKALYVNRLMTEYIVGMPREESDALLERVFDHQEQPQFQYEHRWEAGDLVIWDNRCTLHARRDFPAMHLRKLRRVAVKGERPV